jgi:hypothetical protein
MTRSVMTLAAVFSGFAGVAPILTAPDSEPLTCSRILPVESATVWKACLDETNYSQGHRIEAERNPYVLWLFFDFGDVTHPLTELAAYAESPEGLGFQYGKAEIKLTVQSIARNRTKISASGFFESLSRPMAAAYLPLQSKGVLERRTVDSISQRLEAR